MDARWSTVSFLAVSFTVLAAVPADAFGRSARTQNFIIQADTPEMAQQVGQHAERYRSELARQWLGRDLPPWPSPCTLKVVAGNMPAQGVTTYNRYPGHVGDFQMEVVGTPERILDSVLPHEVTHAVLATHFGRPLPRWADEGVSTTVEHPSERSKHDMKLREFLSTRRGLPMNRMFLLKDYPSDMLPLYAQGYSVCRFLIEQNGHREFIQFIEDYMDRGSWTAAVQQHYGYESLGELQEHWLNWVADGSGAVDRYTKRAVSAQGTLQLAAAGQSPAAGTPPSMMRTAELQVDSANPASRRSPAVAAVASLSGAASQGRDASEGGWYLRRRQAAQAGTVEPSPDLLAAGSPAAGSPAVAPETSPARTPARYSVSQPQPEQSVTQSEQGAVQLAPDGPAAQWSPSQDTKWR